MKNLKKVLLALVVVAMLVSSIVTIAIANESEPEYTGSVEEAQKLYDAVLAEEIKDDLAKKSTALVAFYAYIDANPINPAAEGYAALLEAYNKLTYEVANGLYGVYLGAKSTESLKAVFTHVAAAPSLDETVAIEEVEYADFVKAVNFASVEYADELVDALFATVTSGGASYYEYLAAQQALTKFFDEVKSLSYAEVNPNPDVYTGNILAVQALIKKIKSNAKLEDLETALAEVYTYLRKTPVNPATDEYAEFIITYYEKCGALLKAFEAELDGAATVAEQIASLKAMSAYLTATPLSEAVIEAFNDILADVIGEYNNFAGNFAGSEKLAAELADIAVITPGTDLTELTALITALENIKEKTDDDDNANSGVAGGDQASGDQASGDQAGGDQAGGDIIPAPIESEKPYIEQKIEAFAKVYDYLAENELDPAANGYAELIAKYNAEKDLIVAYFVNAYNDTTDLDDKYEALDGYGDFLADYPVSEAAIADYYTLKADYVELLNGFAKALKKLVLPTYTPAEAPIITTNVEMLNFMLSNIKGELKDQKVAMSAMYTYLLSVKIDTEAEGYDAFVEAYSAKRTEFTAALFAPIGAAETAEAKLTAFQEVRAYLVATPYWSGAVFGFNELVADAYAAEADAATREKLTIGNEYIYNQVIEVLEFFETDEEPPLDEIFATVETLYAYSLRNYDVTDEIYADFVGMFDSLFEMMGESFNYYFAYEALMNAEIDKVSAVCEFYKKVPFSQTGIENFNAMIDTPDDPATPDVNEADGFIQILAFVAEDVENEFANPSYIYNELNALVTNFNKAEGLDNRIEAFKALYDAKAAVENSLLTSVQAGDAAFRAAYADVCEKMAAEIVASVIADTTTAPAVQLASFNKAYDFLLSYNFSQAAVDGYNAKLTAVKAIDFSAVATSISTECPELEYESPEGTLSDFEKSLHEISGLKSLKEYIDAAANSDKELTDAYKYLGGNFKKAKPFDFAKFDFAMLVMTFAEAKEAAIARYTDAIDAAALSDKPAQLDAMYKFVKKNMISSGMVEAYAKKCDDVGAAFTAAFNAAYKPYEEAVAAIHKHLSDCAADLSLLTEAELAVYEDVQLKLDALEYSEVYGQILGFKTATGDGKYVFLVQNQMADAITGYLNAYEVSDNYTEYALSNALFAQAAEDFIGFYAEYIDLVCGDNDAMKAQAVASLKSYIEEKLYCKVMADLFNATFAAGENDAKIVYDLDEIIPEEAIGTIDEYSALMKSYMDVKLRALVDDNDAYTTQDYNEYGSAKLMALEALFAYLEKNPLDAKSPMAALNEAIVAAKAELAELTEAQKQKAEAETPESEYALGTGTVWNFEDGKLPGLSQTGSVKKSSVATETLADGSENKYWLLETSGTSTYWNMPLASASLGSVYEFDVRLPIGLPLMKMDFRPVGSAPNVSGTAYQFNAFENGVFSRFDAYDPNHPADVQVKFSQGEWTHVIVVLNPIEFTITMYVDYVKLGTVPLTHNNNPNPLTATNLRINFQTANTAIELDNIQYYAGTAYRQPGKFDGMSDGDKFKYYVDFFTQPEYEPVSRIVAYNKAAAMVESYRGLDEYKSYVESVDYFDVDSVIPAEAKAEKLANLVDLMVKSGADNVSSENYTTVTAKLSEIEAYMVEYSYYLDQASFEYNDVKAKVAAGYSEITRVEQLLELIDTLKLFQSATTVTGMTKRAAAVAAEYEKCNFTEVDNYVKASNDAAITAFLATVGEDITLDMYYKQLMAQRIAERQTYENSGKIVSSVNKLKAMVANASELTDAQFLEALMAAAKENFDYTNAYMTVIRNIIKSGNYDKTYAGLDEAIRVFNHLDGYFYQLVVEAQLAVIKGQLDRYPLTTSYIDKLGVCTYVRKYIAENSVDVKDPIIAPYYTMLLAFEEELKSYEDEYESILESNTAAFIALVERMSAFVEYKDIKPLYDEALNNYFYNMNQDSDAAKAAMATFDAYAAIVKATEENSALFIAAADKLSKATKTNAIYKALVECAAYVDGVDSSIDGVADALKVYNEKLSAYNAKINPVNEQIEESSNVVCSVRTVSVDATVLATIKKIINE